MEIMSRGKKGFALLIAMLAVFAFAGTALADDVDSFLDQYEKFVVKTEDLAKKDTVSSEQANDFLKSYQEFIGSAQKSINSETKLSDAQEKRANELTQRLQAASTTIQSKQQK